MKIESWAKRSALTLPRNCPSAAQIAESNTGQKVVSCPVAVVGSQLSSKAPSRRRVAGDVTRAQFRRGIKPSDEQAPCRMDTLGLPSTGRHGYRPEATIAKRRRQTAALNAERLPTRTGVPWHGGDGAEDRATRGCPGVRTACTTGDTSA